MKPLTTMLMIGERERETATVVRVYCNTVNKYAYINLVSLSIHQIGCPTLSLSLSLATTCVRENDISLPTTSEEIPPARLYYTVYTQTRQRLFIESLWMSCHVHIAAASSSLKVTLSVLHLTVVLCLLKSFVNTT